MYVFLLKAIELMLQKNNAQVSTYAPFRFQPDKGPKGPSLKIVVESTENGPDMSVLTSDEV